MSIFSKQKDDSVLIGDEGTINSRITSSLMNRSRQSPNAEFGGGAGVGGAGVGGVGGGERFGRYCTDMHQVFSKGSFTPN